MNSWLRISRCVFRQWKWRIFQFRLSKNLVGFDSTAVKYAQAYLNNGFNPAQNKGEVFFQTIDPPWLDFAAGSQAENQAA
jgi:hypothetical protein